MAITNKFVALKHGHIVATELSRAQLWLIKNYYLWINLLNGFFVVVRMTAQGAFLQPPHFRTNYRQNKQNSSLETLLYNYF